MNKQQLLKEFRIETFKQNYENFRAITKKLKFSKQKDPLILNQCDCLLQIFEQEYQLEEDQKIKNELSKIIKQAKILLQTLNNPENDQTQFSISSDQDIYQPMEQDKQLDQIFLDQQEYNYDDQINEIERCTESIEQITSLQNDFNVLIKNQNEKLESIDLDLIKTKQDYQQANYELKQANDLTIRSRKNKITGVFSAVLGLFGLQYGTTQAVVGATIGTGVGKGTAELMLNGVQKKNHNI